MNRPLGKNRWPVLTVLLLFFLGCRVNADDGYRLWLKYDRLTNSAYRQTASGVITQLYVPGNSSTLQAAREELQQGLSGLLGKTISVTSSVAAQGTVLAVTPQSYPVLSGALKADLAALKKDGYLIRQMPVSGKACLVIAAKEDLGVLYGAFHLLRLLQSGQPLTGLSLSSSPKLQWRMLNHWDNLNGTVERGYAGGSLWKWQELPERIDPRYKDYARANASVGINAVAINNVNAKAQSLNGEFLTKAAALANVFRPYGIKVFLSARFSSPKEMGLSTADPLDPKVQQWWKDKANEIYALIPDFGGFLVKANSEGQPGPQDYKRNHADGANMLADALAPHGGLLIWRAFVYAPEGDDRAKEAFHEFKPLDGKFRPNVFVQTKNGAIDFQPREPFHPMFGAMPQTAQMLEVQLTQEYFGYSTHLVYLATLFRETLEADTYVQGKGSTVAKIIDGTLQGQPITGMAGVANTGNNRNWTGHPFAQANWFAFGRLAWDHTLSAEAIAEEWARMTFENNPDVVKTVVPMMLTSREAAVNYQTPLGLTHLCAQPHHYGPRPWESNAGRPDWTALYYHRADTGGMGFNRTTTGTNALSQYSPEVQKIWGNVATCPENLLLWFHRLPWTHRYASGQNLWEELVAKYYDGVTGVRKMQTDWATLRGKVDSETFENVQQRLTIQENEAVWWRDTCLWYFGQFSRRPIPESYEKPRFTPEAIQKRDRAYAEANW